ncbi:hypothetical protein QYF36_017449 [Acer negundo]|nr:hypothetical protein QYF36_017449 [Acer negundo]
MQHQAIPPIEDLQGIKEALARASDIPYQFFIGGVRGEDFTQIKEEKERQFDLHLQWEDIYVGLLLK